MKSILKNFLLNFFCLLLISYLIPAIDYSGKTEILILASLVLALVNILIKPLLNILFLPINLISLGMFRWVINVIVLGLVTIIVPTFKIKSFFFSGFNFQGFIIPSFNVSLLWSYVLVSFLITLILNFLNSILK